MKSYVTIPYNRIQNVDIYRGVMARLLGLSCFWVQTSGIRGMMRGEGLLPGLDKNVAEQLRTELIKRIEPSKSQGLWF